MQSQPLGRRRTRGSGDVAGLCTSPRSADAADDAANSHDISADASGDDVDDDDDCNSVCERERRRRQADERVTERIVKFQRHTCIVRTTQRYADSQVNSALLLLLGRIAYMWPVATFRGLCVCVFVLNSHRPSSCYPSIFSRVPLEFWTSKRNDKCPVF